MNMKPTLILKGKAYWVFDIIKRMAKERKHEAQPR